MLLPDAYSGHGGLMAASREQRHSVAECCVGDKPEVFRDRGYMVCLRLRDRLLCGDQVGGGRSCVGTSPCPIR